MIPTCGAETLGRVDIRVQRQLGVSIMLGEQIIGDLICHIQ